jgi:hypothetical protein
MAASRLGGVGLALSKSLHSVILRSLNTTGGQYSPFYYRTSGGAEVNLIIEGKSALKQVHDLLSY